MKRDDYSMEHLLSAEARRQRVLDHLHAHPLATYAQLVAAVEESPDTMRGIVANMLHTGEIAAHGKHRGRGYSALVHTTVSAATVRAAYLARQKRNNSANAEAYAARKRAITQERAVKRHQQAQADRQMILDYLHAHPGSSMRAVMEHVNAHRPAPLAVNRISQTLTRMAFLGEVKRNKGGAIDPAGKHCSAWFPVKAKTVTWEEMRDLVTGNLEGGRDKAPRQVKGPNGGRLYISGDNPEIGRYPSGGQGALVRAAVGSGMYGLVW